MLNFTKVNSIHFADVGLKRNFNRVDVWWPSNTVGSNLCPRFPTFPNWALRCLVAN